MSDGAGGDDYAEIKLKVPRHVMAWLEQSAHELNEQMKAQGDGTPDFFIGAGDIASGFVMHQFEEWTNDDSE